LPDDNAGVVVIAGQGLLFLIFARLCSWLVLFGRSSASKDAELLVLPHEGSGWLAARSRSR
jgi:hypothetical protein